MLDAIPKTADASVNTGSPLHTPHQYNWRYLIMIV